MTRETEPNTGTPKYTGRGGLCQSYCCSVLSPVLSGPIHLLWVTRSMAQEFGELRDSLVTLESDRLVFIF